MTKTENNAELLNKIMRGSAKEMRSAATLVRELPKESDESRAVFALLAEAQGIYIQAWVDNARLNPGERRTGDQLYAAARQEAINITFTDIKPGSAVPVDRITMPHDKTLTAVAADDKTVMNQVTSALGKPNPLAAMLIYAKANEELFPKGRSVDKVKAGVSLVRPNATQINQGIEAILGSGLLADGRISYNREIKGKDIDKILAPQTPAMAHVKAGAKLH